MRIRRWTLWGVLVSLLGLPGIVTAQVDDTPSLAGVIDIHAHVAPETSMLNFKRAFDAIEAAQIARIYGMRGIVLKEHNTETASWAYLASQAVSGVEVYRKELLVEWAEKLYDAHAQRRMDLLKSLDDISPFLTDLGLYYSGTILSLLAEARPDDSESEAIGTAIAGRRSDWLAKIALRFPVEAAAEENSGRAAKRARVGNGDPIAAKRRAQVDDYIEEVFRVRKKHISRSDIWKTAGYKDATAFQRWQRNDRRSSESDNRAFTRLLLLEKPNLK